MKFLITNIDGDFVRWSDTDSDRDADEYAQRVCDACVEAGVDWQDIGPAECDVEGRPGEKFCPACRDGIMLMRSNE